MSNHTLVIVFRNGYPERTPITSELHLIGRNGRDGRHYKSTFANPPQRQDRKSERDLKSQ